MIRKLLKAVVFSLILFGIAVAMPMPINAITIGISPVDISNDILIPGSKLSTDFTFSLADLEQDMLVGIEVESGEIADWISFSTGKSFEYKKEQANQKIVISIDVPQDAKLKAYNAIIRFKAQEITATKDVARVVSGTRLDVAITVTNNKQEGLRVSMASVKLSEDGEKIILTAKTSNNGNYDNGIDKAVLLITDLNNKTITELEQEVSSLIPAFSSQDTIIEFANSLKKGEYYANVSLYSGNGSVYENKLLLNVDKVKPATVQDLAINTNDYIILAVATVIGFVALLIILKFAKKRLTTSAVIITIITIIPILALLSFYGYYGKLIYDRQQQQAGEDNIQNADVTETEAYILLDETTIKFKQDTEVFEAAVINPKVKLIAAAGSSYTIVAEVNNWYKLEIAPDDFAYIKKN